MATVPNGAWNSSAIGIRTGATAKRSIIVTNGPADSRRTLNRTSRIPVSLKGESRTARRSERLWKASRNGARPVRDRVGVVVDEVAGLALHHDLRDAAYSRSDDRSLASHRLEVDQTERLVYGRTHEYRGTGVQMDKVFERDEAADPHQVASLGAHAIRQGGHLSADLGRV